MKKFLIQGGSLQRNASIACVLGALVAGCATGTHIGDEEVIFISSARPSGDLGAPEGEGAEAPGEGLGDDGLEPAGESNEDGADEELPRSEQPGDEEPSSEPTDDDTEGDSSEPVPPADVPIIDTDDPDVDDPDDTPGPGSNPIIQPDPVPPQDDNDDPPGGQNPVVPPPVTNPTPVPVPTPDPDDVPAPALPASGHCLSGWEGSSCDTCSGQTQSDRLACRLYIDCYITSDCDPGTCGSVEQACGVNRLGNGLAPKEIADSVYGCMCQ